MSSDNAAILDSAILVSLNGADATALLAITGDPTSKSVSLPALVPNALYTAVIEVTDVNGETNSATIKFDTFDQSHYMVEAEDYDFGGAMFIDDPVPTAAAAPNSYREKLGTADIDFGDTQNNGDKIYRTLDAMATPVANDFLRQKFDDAGVSDHKIGWFDSGEWANYTRTWPAGEFLVYGRLAGNPGNAFSLYLEKVTGGVGTITQTTEQLGRFGGTAGGWDTYEWVQLTDEELANPLTVQLGGEETLRLYTTGNNDPNFFMLVPVGSAPLVLTATTGGGNVQLSFPTANGVGYELLYKDDLDDPQWTMMTTVIGDGTTMSVSEPLAGDTRFYVLSRP